MLTLTTVKNFTGCKIQLLLSPIITLWLVLLQVVTNSVGCHWILNPHRTLEAGGVVEAVITTTGVEMACHGITMAMGTATKTTCQSKADVLENSN